MKGTIGLFADDTDRLPATLIHLGRHELDGGRGPVSRGKDNRLSGGRHSSKTRVSVCLSECRYVPIQFYLET